jgi:hypothetical protein
MQTQGLTMSAPKPMEHRWGERVAIDCPARLVFRDGTEVEGRICNASISGALIEAAIRLPANATLNVVFVAGKPPAARVIELPACVVRNSREGVAVEWRDMAVPTLITLLRDAGGDETALCRRS